MSQSKLTVNFPDGTQMPFNLTLPSVTIGSGISSTVIIPHESVAESHVELSLDVTGYLITDLVGEGATLLNGHPLEQGVAYQLEPGSLIHLGQVEAFYESESPEVHETEAEAAAVDFPTPGSFDLPKHPAGVFVPLKKKVNPLMVVSVALAVIAALSALFIGFSSGDIKLPR